MSDKPLVFLAFANTAGDLPELRREASALQELFEGLAAQGLCRLLFKRDATPEVVFRGLLENRRDLAIFHYGGHADEGRLLLDSAAGSSVVHSGGLAGLLGGMPGLKLVFLNGCSTRPQVQKLLEYGVRSIIATAEPIADRVACDFSIAFYKAMTTGGAGQVEGGGKSLTGGHTVDAAFEIAKDYVAFVHGDDPRSLVRRDLGAHDIANNSVLPWELFMGPSTDRRWHLFLDDPLWGLPEFPNDIPLPAVPYRNLAYFAREHARVFFGRGREIRELFHLVDSKTAPGLILYYGPTGVGKSSVLAGGLLPRLEAGHRQVYCRRDPARGLVRTLTDSIMELTEPGFDRSRPIDAETLRRSIETHSNLPLVVVLDQAEEVFTRPMPGVVPAAGEADCELSELMAFLRAFSPTPEHRAATRFIVGFRKEWLQEVLAAADAAGIDYVRVDLAPLDRAAVVEAIDGPTRDPALRDRYRLEIESGLADRIAFHLLSDEDARGAMAPTLQTFVSKMWERARAISSEPRFTDALFETLRDEGYLLSDFLDQNLKAIDQEWKSAGAVAAADPLTTGLILDLLEAHATHMGTARRRTWGELRRRYVHLHDDDHLRRIVSLCESHYLLIHVDVDRPPHETPGEDERLISLAHDTLASLVRARFLESDASGQKARRLLENRVPEWRNGRTGNPLDAVDLGTVEDGLAAMRDLEPDERRLVEASQDVRARQQAGESIRRFWIRVLKFAALLGGGFSLLLAIVSWFGWNRAARYAGEKDQANTQLVSALAENREQQLLTTIEYARSLTAEGVRALSRGEDLAAGHRFAKALELFSGDVSTALAPVLQANEGIAARIAELDRTNRIRLRMLAERSPVFLRRIDSEQPVKDIRFGASKYELIVQTRSAIEVRDIRNGRQIAKLQRPNKKIDKVWPGLGDILVVAFEDDPIPWVWNSRTFEVLARPEAHKASLLHVAFDASGKRALTTGREVNAYLWDLPSWTLRHVFRGHENSVLHAAFSPDGRRVATACYEDTVRVWDTETGALLHRWGGLPTGSAYVEFSADGTRLLSLPFASSFHAQYSCHDDRVRLFDLKDNQLKWEHKAKFDCGLTGRIATGDRVIYSSTSWGLFDLGVCGAEKGESLFHSSGERFVHLARDGRLYLSVTNDGRLRIRNISDGKDQIFPGIYDAFLAMDPQEERLAALRQDGSVSVLNAGIRERNFTLGGFSSRITAAVFSPDSQILACLAGNNAIFAWRLNTPDPADRDRRFPILDACFEPVRGLVGISSSDAVEVRDGITGRTDFRGEKKTSIGMPLLSELFGPPKPFAKLTFSDDGRFASVAFGSNAAMESRRIEIRGTGEDARTLTLPGECFGGFTEEGEHFVSWDADSVLRRTTDEGRIVWDVPIAECRSVRLSPSGRRVVVVCDSQVHLLDAYTGSELLASEKDPKDWSLEQATIDREDCHLLLLVTKRESGRNEEDQLRERIRRRVSIKRVDTNDTVATVDFEGETEDLSLDDIVRAWEAHAIENLAGLKGSRLRVVADGQRALTIDDGKALLWNTVSGRLAAVLEQDATIVHGRFSNDGSLIVTLTDGGIVSVWDGFSGSLLGSVLGSDRSLGGPDGLPIGEQVFGGQRRSWTGEVSFLPDNQRLAVHSADGSLQLHRVSSLDVGPALAVLQQEVLTGATIADSGAVTMLSNQEWHERKARLRPLLEGELAAKNRRSIEAAAVLVAIDPTHEKAIGTLIESVRTAGIDQFAFEHLLRSCCDNEAFLAPLSDALQGSIRTADLMSRRRYLRGLAAIGRPAIPTLASIARSEAARASKSTPLDAVYLLETIGRAEPSAIPVLAEFLGDRDDAVAGAAVESLGRLGNRAVLVLQASIGTGPPAQRLRVVMALQRMGRTAMPALEALVPMMGDPDARLAAAARDTLKAIGPETVPVALKLLENSNAPIRIAVAELIAGTAPPAEEAAQAMIRLAVTDDDKTVRTRASEAFRSIRKAIYDEQFGKKKVGEKPMPPAVDKLLFAEFGSGDARRRTFSYDATAIIAADSGILDDGIPEELARQLDDENEAIRVRVAEVLLSLRDFSSLAKHVEFGCRFLLERFASLDTEGKDSAAYKLRMHFKARHKNLIPSICPLLHDPNPVIRWGIADSMGNLGEFGGEAVPALTDAMKDPAPLVRLGCVESLSKITGSRVQYVSTLLALLEEPAGKGWSHNGIASVSNMLAELPVNSPNGVARLINVATNKALPMENRVGALQVLMAREPDPARIAPIVDLWRDGTLDENLRLKLVKYLLQAGYTSDDILPLVEKSLSRKLGRSWVDLRHVNVAADCLVLSRRRSERARTLVEESLKEEKGLTRLAVLTALLRIGEEPERVGAAFSAMLGDDDRSVRENAVYCLGAATKDQLRWAEPLLKVVENPDEDPRVRTHAADSLKAYGKTVQPMANRLVPLLRVEGRSTARSIAELVAELDYGDRAVHPLVEAFEAPNAVDRLELAQLIIEKLDRQYAPKVGEYVVSLLERRAAGDEAAAALDDSTISDAIRLVVKLGKDGRDFVPRLKALVGRYRDERPYDHRTELQNAIFLVENEP